ncbi:MAG: protein yceI precursor [Geobacter sp.]|nr:protein yceI precursor [Geobacter sp.]
MKHFFAMIAVFVLLSPLNAAAATYRLDPVHSSIEFKVKHLMITNVKGIFENFDGTVFIDEKDITKSKIEVSIETNSINTNIAKRDDHLRSQEFFDAAKFPTMTFVSTQIKRSGNNKLKVIGDLTIKGVTRAVVLNVEGPTDDIKTQQGEIKRGASALAKINRQDFGISWSKKLDGGGLVVADDVFISIDTELVKQ